MKLTLPVFSLHRQVYLLLNLKKFLYGQFSLFLPLLHLLLVLPFPLSSPPPAFLSFFLSFPIYLPPLSLFVPSTLGYVCTHIHIHQFLLILHALLPSITTTTNLKIPVLSKERTRSQIFLTGS